MTDAIKKAKLFVKKVNEFGVPVKKSYLFGSYAKGTDTEDSDIDICVVSDSFSEDFIKEIVNLRKISLKIDSKIEPIPFRIEEINDQYNSLATEIKKTGILL